MSGEVQGARARAIDVTDELSADWPPIRFATAADGTRLSYRRFDGTGPAFVNVRTPGTPPIALLPEIYQRTWLDRFRRGREFFFFDWRGSGQSAPIRGELSIDQLELDLDAIIEVAGRPVDAIVHGLAALTASNHAVRHPDRYRSITFLAGVLRAGDSSYGFYYRQGWEEQYREQLRIFAKQYYWLDPEETSRFALRWASAVPQNSHAAYRASERAVDLTDVLPRISLPAWVLAHLPMDHEGSRNVATLLPDASLSIYRESAGAPPLGSWSRDEWDANLGVRLGDPPSRPAGRAAGTASDLGAAAAITPREREVLRLVATGATNKEIAKKLQLSHWTIQRHVSSLLRKTDLKNRRELMRFADRYFDSN